MTEQEAFRKLDLHQEIHYDFDVIDIYFDVHWDDDYPYVSDSSQAFYKGANITKLVDWEKVNKVIDWKKAKQDANEQDY